MIVGQDRAVEQFASAWATRKLHHAWLLAGPKGVGKASFAHAAARRVLADAAGPVVRPAGHRDADDHPIVKLVEAGSHPDMRWLERADEREDRQAQPATSPSTRCASLGEFCRPDARRCRRGAWWSSTRVDELEASARQRASQDARGAAAPTACSSSSATRRGGLLPTIRSRCRRLDFSRSTMTP